MTRIVSFALSLGLSMAGIGIATTSAGAQAAYSKDDIIKHFSAGPGAKLGATRGLCIGTEAECAAGTAGAAKAAAAAAAPAVPAFDLVVTFGLNSDVLTDGAKGNLLEFAKALKDPLLSSASFVVEGHTDGRGSDALNQALSERRAAAVVAFLTEQGVSQDKLKPTGLGKAKPRVADIFDPANRRVETRLRTE
jgi:outer membrane protein OmpA-like peptidoglycan-associated protein